MISEDDDDEEPREEASAPSFYPKHPALPKIFARRDSCDERERLFSDHLMGNLFSMVEHTLTHHHPRSSRRASKTTTTSSLCEGNEFEPEEGHDDNDGRAYYDFVEMLFYGCREGNVIGAFEKMMRYLTDEYFMPVNPERVLGENPFAEDPKGDYEGGGDFSAEAEKIRGDLRKKCKEIITVQNKQKQHKMFSDGNNVNRTEELLKTADLVKKFATDGEKKEREEYERMKKSVKKDLLHALRWKMAKKSQSSGGEKEREDEMEEEEEGDEEETETFRRARSLEDLEEFARSKKEESDLKIELALLKYVNCCESSYLYLRFFALAIIAKEPNVAWYVGNMSDGFKFANFPLYLRFLIEEIENTPFNAHNVTFLIKNFVFDASLYYSNGIVKAGTCRAFYEHPEYVGRGRTASSARPFAGRK
jgi:hypothetical protein